MTRHFGLPNKEPNAHWSQARRQKPLGTLFISAIFGVIGAAVAILSFAAARDLVSALFQGGTLFAVVLAAGFGCWVYVWIARPRFAAQFSIKRDPFSQVLRFYAKAALALCFAFALGRFAAPGISAHAAAIMLCAAGGAGAAAAFQTVIAFVPGYDID